MSRENSLPDILEHAENGLTLLTRELFAELYDELQALNERFAQCEQRINVINQNN